MKNSIQVLWRNLRYFVLKSPFTHQIVLIVSIERFNGWKAMTDNNAGRASELFNRVKKTENKSYFPIW